MIHLLAVATSTCRHLFIWLALPPKAQAYLNPGTGSYLLQIVLGGLLAAGLVIRLFWQNIRAFFRKLGARAPRNPEEQPHEN